MNMQSLHNVIDMRILSDRPHNSNAVTIEIKQCDYNGNTFTTEITLFGDGMPLDKRKALIEALS